MTLHLHPLLEDAGTVFQAFFNATPEGHVGVIAVPGACDFLGDDLGLFIRLSKTPRPKTALDTPIQIVTPAFMISELKRGFEIGFLLFVPFLVIDLVVASVLMSMGMMMLPPVTVSLPFKLIFFVLVNGWQLVAGSLVQSFQHGGGVL